MSQPPITSMILNLANNDTEYYVILPSGWRRFSFQCRQSVDIRFAFETGKVASLTNPYLTLKSDTSYKNAKQLYKAMNIYFACTANRTDTPNVEVEIEYD